MKKIVCLLMLFTGIVVSAMPVMNENVSTSRLVTIYPDHNDLEKFYMAPNVMTIAKDRSDRPQFSYTEYKVGKWYKRRTRAVVQMTMKAQYHEDDIAVAIEEIKQRKPNARFATLPFLRSQIIFGDALKDLVIENNCTHIGGQVGDELACTFLLNSTGRKVFRKTLQKNLSLAINFEYTVDACAKTPDNGCVVKEYTYAIAARLNGEELKNHVDILKQRMDSYDDYIDYNH